MVHNNCIVFTAGARKKDGMDEQMQRWQEDLDARLKGKKIPPKYWEFPEMEKGNLHKHCAHCVDVNCVRSLENFTDYEDMCCHIVFCRQVNDELICCVLQPVNEC